jgi:hypothetical protein
MRNIPIESINSESMPNSKDRNENVIRFPFGEYTQENRAFDRNEPKLN